MSSEPVGGRVRPDIHLRRAEPDDDAAVTALLRESLGKQEDPHYRSFLDWKHKQNPFGESPAWVAVHGSRIIGFRTFLRWRFREGASVIPAVRAVDTATDPAYRGQGIFKALTLQAVADLTVARERFVFNTPNDQSRPGYLSMGWVPVGRVPVGVQLSGPSALRAMARSRVPAQLWAQPCEAGLAAIDFFADPSNSAALLTHRPDSGVHTDQDAAYLRWRTGFEPLGYRVLTLSATDPAQGAVIFRVRRRGPALEAAIIDLFVPDVPSGVRLVRRVLTDSGADYAIGVRSWLTGGLVPLPSQGPLLTARALAGAPPAVRSWRLTLGDIELF